MGNPGWAQRLQSGLNHSFALYGPIYAAKLRTQTQPILDLAFTPNTQVGTLEDGRHLLAGALRNGLMGKVAAATVDGPLDHEGKLHVLNLALGNL